MVREQIESILQGKGLGANRLASCLEGWSLVGVAAVSVVTVSPPLQEEGCGTLGQPKPDMTSVHGTGRS